MIEKAKMNNEYVAGSLSKPDGLKKSEITPKASFLEFSPVIKYKKSI
jgi:hypothetical protein